MVVVRLPGPEVTSPTLLVGRKPNASSGNRIPGKANLQFPGTKFNDDDLFISTKTGWRSISGWEGGDGPEWCRWPALVMTGSGW